MPQTLPGQVFISYSRMDKDIVRRVVMSLRQQGVKIWVDNERLIPGTPIWEEEIEKAIKASAAVIAVMSPDAKNSEWVRREITLADQNRKLIFPILVRGDEDTSITLRLITRQFIDLRENESVGVHSLYAALSIYLTESNEASQDVQQLNQWAAGEERIASAEVANWNSVLFAALGWGIAGAIGGYMYSEYSELVGGTIGGLIGGFVALISLRGGKAFSDQKSLIWTVLAWTIGGAIGWEIGWDLLTEAIGAGIGMAVFAIIGMTGTFGKDNIFENLKSIAVVALAWTIGGGIGWSISRRWMIDSLGIDYATSWAVGSAIGWAIAGFVTSWLIMKKE